jgi:hypothetical protein
LLNEKKNKTRKNNLYEFPDVFVSIVSLRPHIFLKVEFTLRKKVFFINFLSIECLSIEKYCEAIIVLVRRGFSWTVILGKVPVSKEIDNEQYRVGTKPLAERWPRAALECGHVPCGRANVKWWLLLQGANR